MAKLFCIRNNKNKGKGRRQGERAEIKGEWKEAKKKEQKINQRAGGWKPDWLKQIPPVAFKILFSLSGMILEFQQGT